MRNGAVNGIEFCEKDKQNISELCAQGKHSRSILIYN